MKKKSLLGSTKPYRNPKWLGPQDKVDNLGPILGAKPKKSKVLSTKFMGCSKNMTNKNIIAENNKYSSNEKAQLAAVRRDGYAIEWIDNPSEAVQMAAVKQNGYAIGYISKPSEAVQMAAIQRNYRAIEYIDKPSEAVQMAAVRQDGWAIEYIDNPSEAVQLAAVQQNGRAIQFIKKPTINVKLMAKSKVLSTKFQGCSIDRSNSNIISEYKDDYNPSNEEWLKNEIDYAYEIFNNEEFPRVDREEAHRRIKLLNAEAKKKGYIDKWNKEAQEEAEKTHIKPELLDVLDDVRGYIHHGKTINKADSNMLHSMGISEAVNKYPISARINPRSLKKLSLLGPEDKLGFGAGLITITNKVYIAAWHSEIRAKRGYDICRLSEGAIRIRQGGWDCGDNTIIEFGKYDDDTIYRLKQIIPYVTSPTNKFKLECDARGINNDHLYVTGNKEYIMAELEEWLTPRQKVPLPGSVMAFHMQESKETPKLTYREFANASKAKNKKCPTCESEFKNVHSANQKYCSSDCEVKGETVKKLQEAFDKSIIRKAGFIPYYFDNFGKLRMMFVMSSDPTYGGSKWMIAKGHIDGKETDLQAALREGNEECGVKQSNIKFIKLGWKGLIKGYTESSEMTIYIGEVKDPVDFDKPGNEIKAVKWITPEEFNSIGRNSQKFIVEACVNKIGDKMRFSEIKESRKFTVYKDGGFYGPKYEYGYIGVQDEDGHDMTYIGKKSVPNMNIQQAISALKQQFPGCEVKIKLSKISEGMLNGLTVMSLDQFLDGENPEETELEDEMLGEAGEFGLGSKYRNASHKEMQDYLDRTVFKKKNKLDPYTMPYIHPSNVKKNADGSVPIIDENGDKYDLDALRDAITKRPSGLLKQNEKMKHSNGTATVYYNVGLPALKGLSVNEETGEFVVVDTCPGAGICKNYCFAMKGSYIMFPGVSMKSAQTLNYLLNDPEGFKAELIGEISKAIAKWDNFTDKDFNKGDVEVSIRWHDSGDFFSPEYMDMAWDVAREFPNNLFYAYTKIADVANSEDKPDNFVINFSAGASSTQSNLVNISAVKHSQVVPKDLFYDLIARKGIKLIKNAAGATQFRGPEEWNELKDRLAEKYDIDVDTILSYDEFVEKKMNKTLGTKPKWNVTVLPGEGDVSATDPTVKGTYLMFH